MKNVSQWANTHARLAIGLIACFEFVNGYIGIYLGRWVLPSAFESAYVWGSALVVLGVIWLRQRYAFLSASADKNQAYGLRVNTLRGLFFCNLLMFILLGGIVQHRPISKWLPPVTQAALHEVRSEHPGNTPKKNHPSLRQFKKELRSKIKETGSPTAKRVGYVLLFLLSCVLAYLAAALACQLACSNAGLLAVLVALLGLGILAGGLYFLFKAFRKDLKPYKDMDRAEQKQEWKRFLTLWLVVTIAFILLALPK